MFLKMWAKVEELRSLAVRLMATPVRDEKGDINTGGFVLVAVGFILLVFASVMVRIVITTQAATGVTAEIGSFAGTRTIGDQIPLVAMAAVLLLGVGMMGLGGYQVYQSTGIGGRRGKRK